MFRKTYTKWLENAVIWLLILTILNVFINVVLRYGFNNSSIAIQEMQWHLFSAMFLLGIAYSLQNDSHVRVDVLYDNFSSKKQAIINIVGFFIFILPISFLIIYYGFYFTKDAFVIGEISADPGGLTHRYLIKSIIPISFILTIISGGFFTYDNIKRLKI